MLQSNMLDALDFRLTPELHKDYIGEALRELFQWLVEIRTQAELDTSVWDYHLRCAETC